MLIRALVMGALMTHGSWVVARDVMLMEGAMRHGRDEYCIESPVIGLDQVFDWQVRLRTLPPEGWFEESHGHGIVIVSWRSGRRRFRGDDYETRMGFELPMSVFYPEKLLGLGPEMLLGLGLGCDN